MKKKIKGRNQVFSQLDRNVRKMVPSLETVRMRYISAKALSEGFVQLLPQYTTLVGFL